MTWWMFIQKTHRPAPPSPMNFVQIVNPSGRVFMTETFFFYCRKCVFRFLALFLIRLKIAAPLTIVKYNFYFECEWRKHILRPDNVLLLQSACKSQYLDFAEKQQETNRQRKNIKIDKKFPQWFRFTSLLAILFAQNLRHSKRFSFRLYYSYLLRTEWVFYFSGFMFRLLLRFPLGWRRMSFFFFLISFSTNLNEADCRNENIYKIFDSSYYIE